MDDPWGHLQELADMQAASTPTLRQLDVSDNNILKWTALLLPVINYLFLWRSFPIQVTIFISGQGAVQSGRVQDSDRVSARVPVQAAEGQFRDADLPSERGRKGRHLSADHRRRQLEAGHQDGPG